MTQIPDWADARGPYLLDDAINVIRQQWRDGKQIVLLVGAGISVQSGFPSLGPLGVHLLTLYALLEKQVVLPVKEPEKGLYPIAPAYSLQQTGWTSPCLFPEIFGANPRDVIADALKHRLNGVSVQKNGVDLSKWGVPDLNDFAQGPLGLAWYNTLDLIAQNNPQLIESLFDQIGAHVVPGAAHNLLSQFVSWMNVRLVLTTNFDTLIETSLMSEAQQPFVFDVHIEAPPPPAKMVRQHLSVVKLHGSHYGIRADRTINVPLDDGHLATMLGYFDDNALLLVMDYSGSDARFMGMLRTLVDRKPDCRIIRIDPIATDSRNAFFSLANSYNKDPEKRRIINLYYPHSRFFLLDVLQKCSGKMPNTHSGYSAIPQTPAPHKIDVTFGNGPDYLGLRKMGDPRLQSKVANGLVSVLQGHRLPGSEQQEAYDPNNPYRFAVVTGATGCGVSQLLAQVAESLYKSHQLLWCDLDEAASVGTLVAWIYGFVLNRQPEIPNVPLPLDLPEFDASSGGLAPGSGISLDSLARTASAIWNRLKRDRYLVVIDSVSYAMLDLNRRLKLTGPINPTGESARLNREAKRIILLLAMLSWCANRDGTESQCILTIGTHVPDDQVASKILADLRDDCAEILKGKKEALQHLPGEVTPKKIVDLVSMILGTYEIGDRGVTTEVLQRVGMSSEAKTDSDDSDEDIAIHAFSDSKSGARRVFVNAGPPGKRTSYRIPLDEKPTLEWTGPEDFYDHCTNQTKTLVEWADRNAADQGWIKYGMLRDFLTEAALCNRPRSWCQLLALPCVQEYSIHLSKRPSIGAPADVGTRTLGALIEVSTRFGFLRRQQGAFYYMDGKLREYLRDKLGNPADKTMDEASRRRFEKVHQKMLRYYERTYNVSGDITALNYFYWHSWEYLKSVNLKGVKKSNLWLVGIEELARGLLENSRSARGHLNAYDHTFLLLRLQDAVAIQLDPDSPFQLRLDGLKSQIHIALSELYEGSEDVQGAMALAKTMSTDDAKYWHERQKIHSRGLNLYRSCAAGILALTPDCEMLKLKGSSNACEALKKVAEPDATVVLGVNDHITVIGYLAELFSNFSKEGEGRTRQAWLRERRESSDSGVTHQAIMRLVRTVIRLYRFNKHDDANNFAGRGDVTKNVAEQAVDILSAGKELLASSQDERLHNTKLLWARYHCTSAFCALYLLDRKQYDQDRMTKILYRTSLAKSYALRSGGVVGSAYEAIAGLHEANALIWEGRLLMGSKNWVQARARQLAAMRAIAESQRILRGCRLSLAWWRETAILLCGVAVDTVKCSLASEDIRPTLSEIFKYGPFRAKPGGSEETDDEKEARNKQSERLLSSLEEAVALFLSVTSELCFLRVVVRNDFWRETRFAYHLFRLSFYTRGILALSSSWCASCDNEDHRQRLVTLCNQSLRVFRLISEEDSQVPLLPMRTKAEKLLKGESDELDAADAEEWRKDLDNKIKDLWSKTAKRLDEANFGPLEEASGLYGGSLEGLIKETKKVFGDFEDAKAMDWNVKHRVKWLTLCSKVTLVDNQGHGDF